MIDITILCLICLKFLNLAEKTRFLVFLFTVYCSEYICSQYQLSFFVILCHPTLTGLTDFDKKFCNRWKYFLNTSHLHCCQALAGPYCYYNSPQRTVIIVHINWCLWRKAVKVRISFQKLKLGFHQQFWYILNILCTTSQSVAKLN